MNAYYNEFDPYAAEWLRNLINRGLIADGEVDGRSIVDVRADDLRSFTQCHFFAGIGVWSHALRLAGWPDDRPVWTGSCPCQPFSAAGKGKGVEDERHLWPEFHRLIAERRPPVVFGEQVASKDGLGWLDAVCAGMEASGYAIGAADLCAAGCGAPHIRQRLWFVAERLEYSDCSGSQPRWPRSEATRHRDSALAGSCAGGLADTDSQVQSGRGIQRPGEGDGESDGASRERFAGLRSDGGLADTDKGQRGWLSDGEGRQHHGPQAGWQQGDGEPQSGSAIGRPGPTNGIWRDADWLHCRDGKWRPVEPGTFPLAHGAPSRVGRLRAYGNAIVAQAAAEVIGAYMDVRAAA